MPSDLQHSKALIFSNLLNGVPREKVAENFRTSSEEIDRAFSFVLRKIKSYCFLRKLPPVLAVTVEQVKHYKITCLQILPKLNLDKEPEIQHIQEEKLTVDNAETIGKNLKK